jgi:hypothetical protein
MTGVTRLRNNENSRRALPAPSSFGQGIVSGDRARKIQEWFEAILIRAAKSGIRLEALSSDELREL